jgi:hemerythrin superfamily protein
MTTKKAAERKSTTKRDTKTTPKTRGTKKKTTYEKVERAIASTASFAANVARGTEERIRVIASAVTAPADDSAPRATDLLVSQHRKVEKLLEQVESANGDLESLLREIADSLSSHIDIEEKLFYPAVRSLDPDLILECLEEHAMGRFALQRLLGTKASDQALKARLKALQELMVNHHREEERDLFPKARKAMSNDELQELGASMKTLFDKNVARGHEALLATYDDQPKKPVHAITPARARRPATSRYQ